MTMVEGPQAEAKGARLDADARRPAADSFELIRACGLRPEDPIIFVGEADAPLLSALLDLGHRDVTVIDSSPQALEALRAAFRTLERQVKLIQKQVLEFRPDRRYALWHDRGFFHRLTHPDDRGQYVEVVQQALRPDGHLVIATCGPQGPEQAAGVPVMRYSAETLAAELGRQFELAEHGLVLHPSPVGEGTQLLQCRFRRRAPHWP
jgi:SAM-dependent methyltransferase